MHKPFIGLIKAEHSHVCTIYGEINAIEQGGTGMGQVCGGLLPLSLPCIDPHMAYTRQCSAYIWPRYGLWMTHAWRHDGQGSCWMGFALDRCRVE